MIYLTFVGNHDKPNPEGFGKMLDIFLRATRVSPLRVMAKIFVGAARAVPLRETIF